MDLQVDPKEDNAYSLRRAEMLRMALVCSSETSVSIYECTRLHNSEYIVNVISDWNPRNGLEIFIVSEIISLSETSSEQP